MIAELYQATVTQSDADHWFAISRDATWVLWSVILGGVALSIYLEQNYRWAARLSGPVLGLLMAMTLSTLGVMPTDAPSYAFIGDYLVPMAIPLLLFKADLLRIIKVTGKMFVAFHLSVLGTFIGAIVATLLMRDRIDNAPEIGGIMTASYSGGSVNFAAVKSNFQEVVGDRLTNSLLVADNFIMAGFFLVLLVLAGNRFLLTHFAHPEIASKDNDPENATTAAAEHWAPKKIGLLDLAIALAVAFAIATIAKTCADTFQGPLLGNLFVWITVISLATATAFRKQLGKVEGATELGTLALYIYLFSIGLPASLLDVLQDVPAMFGYCAIMASVNVIVTLGLGKLLRQNLEDLLISINATLGGPPSAVAMAVSKGWSRLVLPAMLVGIWGYVIGTTLGIATAHLLQELFG